MTRFRPGNLFVVCALMVLFPGCRAAGPPVNYYTLSPLNATAAAATSAEARPIATIAIDPVQLPGYLDRVNMVKRSGAHRVEIESFHRWVDYPDRLVQQTLVKNLQRLLPDARVVNSPWPVGTKPDLMLAFQFHELIGTADQTVEMCVTWTIRRNSAAAANAPHRLMLSEPTTDAGFDALAASHSRILERLCRQVAESLRSDLNPAQAS